MSYLTGLLDKRITIYNRAESVETIYGRKGGDFVAGAEISAGVTWSKGAVALQHGSIEHYDTIMVRTRYRSDLIRESRIWFEGAMYAIDSFHADKRANTIQITAHELTGNV